MCTVLLPPGVNPNAVNKYIKYIVTTELFSVWIPYFRRLEKSYLTTCRGLKPSGYMKKQKSADGMEMQVGVV